MKFYLSSFRMGNDVKKLKSILPRNKKTALIMNAIDFSKDLERRRRSELENIKELTEVGLDVEILDLRDYFHRRGKLRKKMKAFGVYWVRGGNTFVLRQAMMLSGFDVILKGMLNRRDVLYGGYSAGICVLSPRSKASKSWTTQEPSLTARNPR
jgi:dipeptidase E